MRNCGRHRFNLLAVAVLLPGAVLGVDLHAMWDDRCGSCHGHSAEFARKFLSVEEGRLQGRHADRDLGRFMQNHYLKNNEIEPVLAMLRAQVETPPLFQARCEHCHGLAAELARRSLEFRHGIVYGRETGQPLREFLEHHVKLEADQVEFFTALLTRVKHEVD